MLLEGGPALGGVEALALALEAALAEPGKYADKTREDAWVVEGGLLESGEIKLGEQFRDAQSDNLLGGFVDLGALILADGVERELKLGAGIFEALLVFEPVLMGAFFPPPEIVFVEGLSGVAQALENLGIGEGLAEHLVNGIANLFWKAGDFVSRKMVELDWRRNGGGAAGRGVAVGCGGVRGGIVVGELRQAGGGE